jgi:DNA polymerase-3 subunit gamma/tau
MDAASETGIDDIRESVIERAKFPPMETRFKVYIIDEVHDLSAKAFDALLKTIEEPPQHVVFVLATTEWSKVPPTIRSRCQQHEFRRGSVPNLVARLKTVAAAEGIEVEPGALATIARMADGGFRDSLSLLELVAGLADGKITHELVNSTLGLISEEAAADILVACSERDGARLLARLDEVLDSGKEPRTILESILYKVEELTRVAHGTPMPGVEPDRMALLQEQVARIGKDTLLRVWPVLAEAHAKMRTSGLPRVWLEVALLSLATAAETPVPKADARPAVVAQVAPTKAVTSAAMPPTSPEIVSSCAPQVAEEPPAPRPPEAEALDPVWSEVLSRISAKFPSAQKTLSGSRVVEVVGKKATVEVRSPLILARLSDPQHRTSRELTTMFREVVGEPGWSLEFRLPEEGAPPPAQVESVPRYLEGEELEKAVEQQLGGKRN